MYLFIYPYGISINYKVMTIKLFVFKLFCDIGLAIIKIYWNT